MKLSAILITIFCSPALFMACKKSAPAGPSGSNTNGISPTFICQSYIGSTPGYNNVSHLTIFDLNHDANKDKAFFIVKFVQNKDSVEVITLPKPIDSMGLNWPATVKSACWGYSGDMIVDAHRKISSSSIPQPPGVSFRLDSMKNVPIAIATYNYLNNILYAGSLAGVKPTAEAAIKVPLDYFGNFNGRHAIIYGKQRVYRDVSNIAGELKHIDEMFTSPLSGGSSVSGFDWENVDCSVCQFIGSGLSRYYYFDFKAWRYFTVSESYHYNSSTNVSTWLYTASTYKSLDNFCKWPEGWKKP